MGLSAHLVLSGQAQAREPASPSILAGNLLYVSGQGAQDAQGRVPPEPVAQIRQCLSKVKTIVEAAGLSMDHVVYGLAQANMSFANVVATYVYLDDIREADRFDRVYAQYTAARTPARTLLQPAASTNRVPDASGHWPALVEISIIAVK